MKKVVAIGIFDGVHAGHQQIISTAKHLGEVTVITFDPHPTSVLAPDRTPSQLLPLADRIKFLKQAGAKNVEVISCLLYTSPSPRDRTRSRMPSSA